MGAQIPFSVADYEGAKRMLDEALVASQKTRYKYSLGLVLCLRGITCLFEGEPGQALDCFSQHAALADETSDTVLKTFNIYYLAWLLLKLRHYRLALQLIGTLEMSNRYHTVRIYETPLLRDIFQQYRQAARQALGEEEYNAAYAEGRLLSLDNAMTNGLRQAEAALQP
jgi:hypothetical protein